MVDNTIGLICTYIRALRECLFSQVWSCAPRFQRPITEFNQNYSMMLGHCFGYSARDGFRRSERVVPLEDEVGGF